MQRCFRCFLFTTVCNRTFQQDKLKETPCTLHSRNYQCCETQPTEFIESQCWARVAELGAVVRQLYVLTHHCIIYCTPWGTISSQNKHYLTKLCTSYTTHTLLFVAATAHALQLHQCQSKRSGALQVPTLDAREAKPFYKHISYLTMRSPCPLKQARKRKQCQAWNAIRK